MKFLSQTLVIMLLVIPPAIAQFETRAIKLTPAQPEAGQSVNLTYDPKGTKLATEATVEGVVYALENGIPVAMALPLVKDGSVWKATFSVPEKAKALAFSFSNGSKRSDTNDEKGYVSYLYKSGTIMPGSRAALGDWFSGSNYHAGLDADRSQAKVLFLDEFKANPSLKRQLTPQYLRLLDRRSTTDKATMEAEIGELAKNTDLTAEEFSAVANTYETLGKTEESEKYRKQQRAKFPNAGDALIMAYRRFNRAKDVAAKKSILDSVRVRFAESRELDYFDGYMTGDLAGAYVKAGKANEVSQLANTPARTAAIMRTYNSIAWSDAEKDTNLVQSAQLSKQATEWAKEQIGKPRAATDSKAQTDVQLNRNRKSAYAQYADTYGYILLKQGKPAEAIPYLKDAVTYGEYKEPEINERYAQALAKTGANSELVTLGKKVIAEGNSNEKLEELFKTAYTKETGAAGYDATLSGLKKEAAANVKAELMEKMINKTAPDFTLMDLSGQPVSLASLKGKVVVIDFWATWCGPCVASFPGMQKAVTKYAQLPDVKFLFVNTWQQEADKKKNAADFMGKKNYTFQVLMDDKDDVITNYKVSGIPTKFIIDKNGAIRFKSVGYNGDPDKTANEISQMIDILRATSGQEPTAAKAGE